MKLIWKIVIGLVVIGAIVGATIAFFVHRDHEGKVKDSKRACGTLNTPTPADVSIPSTVPFVLPSGQTLLSVQTQGKTTLLTVSLAGGRPELVSIRDGVVSSLKGLGYKASATDAEPTYEAEGKFSGPLKGTIRVRPLCTGYDTIRYEINQ